MIGALLLDKSERARQRGVTLRLAGPPVSGLRVPADALITILGNLLDNGIDAAADGPAADGWVEVTTLPGTDGSLKVTVRDSGAGISVRPASTVFRAGWSTKASREPGGRGFGLALVHSAVTRLGGTVTARSDLDGAVFELCLPGALRPQPAGEPGQRGKAPA